MFTCPQRPVNQCLPDFLTVTEGVDSIMESPNRLALISYTAVDLLIILIMIHQRVKP